MRAGLRIVFAAHGVDVPEAALRAACDCTPLGTGSLQAVDVARSYGFQQSARYTLTLEELATLVEGGSYPIVFVSLRPIDGVRDTHALAVINIGEQDVTVYDPLRGERSLSKQSFSTAWALRHNLTIIVQR